MSKAKPKLKVMPDWRDKDGLPGFALRRWDGQQERYVLVRVHITGDELKTQAQQPVRLSHEPKYRLYRNRFVLQDGVKSEPDVLVDLLEAAVEDRRFICQQCGGQQHRWMGRCPDCGEWNSLVVEQQASDEPRSKAMSGDSYNMKKVSEIEDHLSRAGEPLRWFRGDLIELVRQAKLGLFPKRHSEVASSCSDELVLRVKHAVLTEERALEKLRREVEAFENFETISRARRESIPEPMRMFVWQRDRGRCAKCGCQERLEFDHIIPLVMGGSNTERNIQLLCESCNRSKGSGIS